MATFDKIPDAIRAIQENPPRPMVAFHGSQVVKDFYLGRLRAHHAADDFIKGTYWKDGKGCGIGCTLHSGKHGDYPTELGIPEWLAHLEDTLFENLPNGKSRDFAVRFVEVIPVGANLEPVKWKFCLFLMEENLERVESLNISADLKKQVKDAIAQVKQLNENASKNGSIDESAAAAARLAASAAYSAAEAAYSAASAAYSAAEAAYSAAEAAYSAEAAAAARLAESAAQSAVAAYVRYADKLLELIAVA